MSITRLIGGLTPGNGEDPRTFPAIFNVVADLVEANESGLSAAESDIGSLQADVSTAQSDIGTLQSDVGTLQSAVCFKCGIASGVNVNTTANPSPLFDTGTELINLGSFTFTSSSITVPTGGIYMVAWNVFFSGTNLRQNPLLGLVVNGSSDDTIVSGHSYMRLSDDHDESSSNASGLINLSAGNTIGIRTSPLANTGAVTTDAGLGSISIHRIGNSS